MMKRLPAVLAAVLLCSSCGGPLKPSENSVETFSGSVQPLAAAYHTFNVANLGEISVTVTAFTPGSVSLGIGYGQPSGTGCGLIQSNVATVGRTALTGQILIKGQYCLAIFDPSGILFNIAPWTVAQNYTVTVSHP